MKLQKYIVIGLVFLAGSLLFIFGNKRSDEKPPPPPKKEVRKHNVPKKRKISDDAKIVFHGPRAKINNPHIGNVSPGCLKFWEQLSQLDMSSAFEENSDLTPPSTRKDCKVLPTVMIETHKRYEKVCKEYQEADRNALSEAQLLHLQKLCSATITVYRAQVTDWLTYDVPIESIDNSLVLADKAIAKYTEDPLKAAETAERLLELEPELYPAAKLSLIGRLMDARTKKGKTSQAAWQKARDALRRARELGGPETDELLKMELGMDVFTIKNKKFQAKLQKLKVENANSATLHFFSAWASYRAGQWQTARTSLARAAEIDPNHYEGLLARMDAVGPGKDPGVFALSLTHPLHSLIPE